jgi:tagatose-1,6-bisphosphate aldolase non-catalytic subunit AgaZ/GatZ
MAYGMSVSLGDGQKVVTNSGSSGMYLGTPAVKKSPCKVVIDSETGFNKVECDSSVSCSDACVTTLKTKVAAVNAKVTAAEVTKLAETSAAVAKSITAKKAAYSEYTAADLASVAECNGKC